MLCVTIGICFLLQEDMPVQKDSGREVSGKISAAPVNEEREERVERVAVSSPGDSGAGSVVQKTEAGAPPAPADPPKEEGRPARAPSDPAPAPDPELRIVAPDSIPSAPATEEDDIADQAEPSPPTPDAHVAQALQEAAAMVALKEEGLSPDLVDNDDSLVREVTSARFVMRGNLIKLILKGNAAMIGHASVYRKPDRVALDLAGKWKIKLPRVPSNRLIQSVRLGYHDDMTRLVFDMKTMGEVTLVPLDRNSLELRIQ